MRYSVVIVAAGKSERFSSNTNKMFYQLNENHTVIDKTVSIFLNDENCKQVIVVLNEEGMNYYQNQNKCGKLVLVIGGSNRMESVYNGLMAITEEKVLIHDGARPWVELSSIHDLVKVLDEEEAALLTIPMQDTVKKIEDGYVVATVDRSTLVRAQTPQGFKSEELRKCYKEAFSKNIICTDDAEVFQIITNKKIKCVVGSVENEKITTIEDIKRRS